ncbi:hypothetical protein K6L44_03770 [Gluconacetobacter entanii]|uniref:hypothetical protein n=1 Tax=Gluconacetobacter entanii TaxID=108528 RepID=UPI001C936632|nr:hypothetical protein [Gluconacetobacter entanii]MBY4639134.1 hypothetical protein [Gluconacetobacter entanii]MCW4579814.1 hypothetical protein [Gluconacetobacter entanii]MCW4583246.1 hypothetical protein [Gluconacetobacter entanii]MCW4586581.1 hypothetical protein [Gluconacetobacter entanii]
MKAGLFVLPIFSGFMLADISAASAQSVSSCSVDAVSEIGKNRSAENLDKEFKAHNCHSGDRVEIKKIQPVPETGTGRLSGDGDYYRRLLCEEEKPFHIDGTYSGVQSVSCIYKSISKE